MDLTFTLEAIDKSGFSSATIFSFAGIPPLDGGRPEKIRRCQMALYVHLVKMTHQGASEIRQASATYETVRKFGESLGCKPLNVVACFGEYDYVGIWDCPNEVAALKLSGCAVSSGDVQVQTLPACKVEDFFQAMSELPR